MGKKEKLIMGRSKEFLPIGVDIYTLTPWVSEATIVFVASQDNGFPPESGPGKYSIENALRAIEENKNPRKAEVSPSGANSKGKRRQWNLNNRASKLR